MSILMTAMALAAAPAPTAAQPAPSAAPAAHAQHAQHAQPDAKAQAKGCCCEKMAKDSKMDCCAKHGKGESAEHSGHTVGH